MQASQDRQRKRIYVRATHNYNGLMLHLYNVWLPLLLISLVSQQLVAGYAGVTGDRGLTTKRHTSREDDFRIATLSDGRPMEATSGARSAFPMTPFSDPFNLFNLFNEPDRENDKKVGRANKLDGRGFHFERLFSSSKEQNSEQSSDKLASTLLALGEQINLRDREQTNTIDNSTLPEPSSPVVLVPGYGGSQLEARLNKPNVVRYFCDHKSDWNDVWINVKLLLPYMIDCLIDNLRLEFDYATNTTKNTAGVEVRVKNASSTTSVEYLNSMQISGFAYYAPLVERLVDELSYERELNIRGAPYDFRKAPNELTDYFSQLKTTSELLFEQNGKKPVTYICHSMGCNNMLYFLQRQQQHWKDKYVRRLISIAAPWAGALSALRAAALGDDLGMPYLFSGSKLIRVQRSLPSTIFLFPHKQVFSGVPLIKSNIDPTLSSLTTSSPELQPNNNNVTNMLRSIRPHEKHYQANDYKPFFDDINHPDGYRMWLNTKDLLGAIEAPGVETWCLVGVGQKTLSRLEYMGEFPYSPSLEIYDDGDGTVSIQSAQYCKKWSEQQELPVHYKEFKANHMEMLKDSKLLQYIQEILDNASEK